MSTDNNNVKDTLLCWMNEQHLTTYKALANVLGVKPNTIDTWKSRGSIPEKITLRYTQMKENARKMQQEADNIPNNITDDRITFGGVKHEFVKSNPLDPILPGMIDEEIFEVSANLLANSPRMSEMVHLFALLDKKDQQRIYKEIKKLGHEKTSLDYLND